MSSFGPPGVSAPHPSLPPRPPPSSAVVSAPAYSSTISAPPSAAATPTTYGPSAPPPSSSSASASSYYGPAAGPQQPQGQPRLGYSRTYAPQTGGGRGGRGGYGGYGSYQHQHQHQQQSYGPQIGPSTYGAQYGAAAVAASAAPHIRNPFPTPNLQQQQYQQHQHAGGYDQGPQVAAAQIASWQGAYMPKDSSNSNSYGAGMGAGAAAAPGYGSYYGASAAGQPQYAGAATSYGPDGMAATAAGAAEADGSGGGGGNSNQEKQKTVYRSGGGKTWADDTLLEWDPSHLRLFVGNLAGEVTDDTLLKAFSRWKSVQKALVKRDKWTKKSRGYGFVSFSDADDFFQAAKEMNGKYIGSHPVVVRKSKTEIKVAVVKEDNKKGAKKTGNGNGNGNGSGDKNKKKAAGSGGDYGRRDPYEAALGPVPSGVHKPGQKTKGGLKLLG